MVTSTTAGGGTPTPNPSTEVTTPAPVPPTTTDPQVRWMLEPDPALGGLDFWRMSLGMNGNEKEAAIYASAFPRFLFKHLTGLPDSPCPALKPVVVAMPHPGPSHCLRFGPALQPTPPPAAPDAPATPPPANPPPEATPPPAEPAPGGCTRTINAGDTMYAISLAIGVDVGAIQSLNPGVRPEALQVGQVRAAREQVGNASGMQGS